MGFIEAMNAAERGLEVWRSKPHNAKWWRRIDGTPIPNDLLVCIAEAIVEAAASAEDQDGRCLCPECAPDLHGTTKLIKGVGG